MRLRLKEKRPTSVVPQLTKNVFANIDLYVNIRGGSRNFQYTVGGGGGGGCTIVGFLGGPITKLIWPKIGGKEGGSRPLRPPKSVYEHT